MANTYSQIFIQIVFVVAGRGKIIPQSHKEELHKYISGIIRNKGQKLYAINCMPDHVHILLSIKPNISLSDLVRDIKNNATNFINKNEWAPGRFCWQKGFGAFSYSKSHVDRVIKYIENQERHHSKRTFNTEYIELLKKFDVEYDERYVFKQEVR